MCVRVCVCARLQHLLWTAQSRFVVCAAGANLKTTHHQSPAVVDWFVPSSEPGGVRGKDERAGIARGNHPILVYI